MILRKHFNDCVMNFMLKWRLKKYMSLHNNVHRNIQFCHYFNDSKSCPFENLGCILKHEIAPLCKFGEKCLKNFVSSSIWESDKSVILLAVLKKILCYA